MLNVLTHLLHLLNTRIIYCYWFFPYIFLWHSVLSTNEIKPTICLLNVETLKEVFLIKKLRCYPKKGKKNKTLLWLAKAETVTDSLNWRHQSLCETTMMGLHMIRQPLCLLTGYCDLGLPLCAHQQTVFPRLMAKMQRVSGEYCPPNTGFIQVLFTANSISSVFSSESEVEQYYQNYQYYQYISKCPWNSNVSSTRLW